MQTMNADRPSESTRDAAAPESLWVTSQFSTKELERDHVLITWMRQGEEIDRGIYELVVTAYGHSRHIQNIRAVPVEEESLAAVEFQFDQIDADLIHRSNASPKRYTFTATLDADRAREQNPLLDRLVHERRQRKQINETGAVPFDDPCGPVLHTSQVRLEPWMLQKSLGTVR